MISIPAPDQAHFIKIPAAVLNRRRIRPQAVFELEYIEMPDILFQVIRQPVEFLFVKIF
jgi:hypothetical protein